VRIVSGLVASVLLVQAFLIPLTAGLNTPAWSISCEAFFYANWPRLVVALRSKRAAFPWAAAVALRYFPVLRLPEFALGVVVGHALKNTPNGSRSPAMDTLREAALVAGALGAAWVFGSGLPVRLSGVPLADRVCMESGTTALLFALIVWQLARGRGLSPGTLSVASHAPPAR
jgi:peptidoglycan/LPS O-acetylase OafA/YrhL